MGLIFIAIGLGVYGAAAGHPPAIAGALILAYLGAMSEHGAEEYRQYLDEKKRRRK